MNRLRILHTCDFHGHLSAGRAEAIQRLRQDRAPCFLFDCGDALGIGNLNPGWPSERTFSAMKSIGYDALAMGNRETHLWWGPLRKKLSGLQFPIISTNLRNPQPPVKHSVILHSPSGIRVGVFALTPAMVLPDTLSARFASVVFDEPLDVVEAVIQSLRTEVDLLVCLSHLGQEADRRIAGLAPQIDLILGGHDHTPGLPQGEQVGGTLLARSSPYGGDIGEVTAVFDSADGEQSVRCTARLLDLPV